MTQYSIELKTESDLKAAKDYEKQLQQLISQTKQLGQDTAGMEKELGRVTQALGSASAIEVQRVSVLEKAIKNTKALGGDTTALTKALHDAEKALGPTSFADKLLEKTHKIKEAFESGTSGGKGLIGGLMGAAGEIGGGTIAGAAAIVEGYHLAKEAVMDYAKAEEENLKLQGSLALRGQLTQEYLEKLQKLSEEEERATTIEASRWQSVIGMLTRFGASEKNIDEVVEGVKNLAGAMGSDIETAAHIMTRAMTGNFEMLGRYNIKVREGASAAENFQFVLSQVKERGAGILEAQSQGISGSAKRISEAFEQMKRSVGAVIAVPLKPLLDQFAIAMEYWADKTHFGSKMNDNFVNSLRGNPEVLQDAAMSQQQLNKEIEKMGTVVDAAIKKNERLKSAIQEVLGLQNDEASARMDVELAQIDDKLSRNKVTKTQAALQKAQVRSRYSREKYVREQEADESTFAGSQTLSRTIEKQYADLLNQKKALTHGQGTEAEMRDAERLFQSLDRGRRYWKALIDTIDDSAGGNPFKEAPSTAEEKKKAAEKKRAQENLETVEEAMRGIKVPKYEDIRKLDQINSQLERFKKEQQPKLEQSYTDQLSLRAQMESRARRFGFQTEENTLKSGTEIFGIKRDETDKRAEEAQKALKEGRKVGSDAHSQITLASQELVKLQRENTKMAMDALRAAINDGKTSKQDLQQLWQAIRELQSVTAKNRRNP
jgi:hypothetical protein